ncbi:hypothetical protein Hanom_Chr12g01148811 [Helianthus anomalus]
MYFETYLVLTVQHVFLDCTVAKSIWRAVSVWCGWDLTGWDSLACLFDAAEEPGEKTKGKCLLAIIYVTCWFIWKARNERTFKNLKRQIDLVREEIIYSLFSWIVNRTKHSTLSWDEWVRSPLSCF